MKLCLSIVFFAFFLMGVAATQDSQKNLWNPVRLQLVGPLDSVTIQCGSAGETRIEIPLLAGERRELQVPLVIEAGYVDAKSDVSWEGTGDVQWPEATGLQALPFVARARLPLPVIPEKTPVLLLPAVLGLAALALLLFFLRKKPRVQIATSLAGAVLLVMQVGVVNPNSLGLVRIIDLTEVGPWKVFDSARGAMPHRPGQSIRLQVKPASAPVTWFVTERAGSLVIEAQAEGALLRKQFSMKPGMLRLQRDLNALASFKSVWVREDSGQWSARGAWALGLALPEPFADGENPPGWLITGLPQGPEVWVAQLTDEVGPRANAAGATQTWLRVRLDD